MNLKKVKAEKKKSKKVAELQNNSVHLFNKKLVPSPTKKNIKRLSHKRVYKEKRIDNSSLRDWLTSQSTNSAVFNKIHNKNKLKQSNKSRANIS
jgi:hypothetical protein